MNKTELKYKVEDTGSVFFSRSSMKFAGDTMANYGVYSKPVMVRSYSGTYKCWELYRRHPVKHGLNSSAFFDVKTFERRHPKI